MFNHLTKASSALHAQGSLGTAARLKLVTDVGFDIQCSLCTVLSASKRPAVVQVVRSVVVIDSVFSAARGGPDPAGYREKAHWDAPTSFHRALRGFPAIKSFRNTGCV